VFAECSGLDGSAFKRLVNIKLNLDQVCNTRSRWVARQESLPVASNTSASLLYFAWQKKGPQFKFWRHHYFVRIGRTVSTSYIPASLQLVVTCFFSKLRYPIRTFTSMVSFISEKYIVLGPLDRPSVFKFLVYNLFIVIV
jgi:hypothetical protein